MSLFHFDRRTGYFGLFPKTVTQCGFMLMLLWLTTLAPSKLNLKPWKHLWNVLFAVFHKLFIFTFRAMTRPEGLWRTLLTTPPFPAPNSQMGSKSSSFSSPTWAFWVRKASSRFLCCSSRSSSPSFFCKASRLALWGEMVSSEGINTHTERSYQTRTFYNCMVGAHN